MERLLSLLVLEENC